MDRRTLFLGGFLAAWLLAGCGTSGERQEKPSLGDAPAASVIDAGPLGEVDVGGYPHSIVARDFNGDGAIDLAVIACDFPPSYEDWSDCRVGAAMGKGNGQLGAPFFLPVGYLRTYRQLAAGDFDGDGVLDLAAASGPADLGEAWWRGVGDGTFAAPVETSSGYAEGEFFYYPWHPPIVGNFSMNQADEIVPGWPYNSRIFENDGQAFVSSGKDIPQSWHLVNGVTADFDEDGFDDLNGWLSNGDGSFQGASMPDGNMSADWNGDGHMDLVHVYGTSHKYWSVGAASVSLGNGDGTFQASSYQEFPELPDPCPSFQYALFKPVGVGDLDADGHPDVVGAGPGLILLFGDGVAFSQSYRCPEGDFSAASIGDFDGDGAADLALGQGFRVVVVSGREASKVSP